MHNACSVVLYNATYSDTSCQILCEHKVYLPHLLSLTDIEHLSMYYLYPGTLLTHACLYLLNVQPKEVELGELNQCP